MHTLKLYIYKSYFWFTFSPDHKLDDWQMNQNSQRWQNVKYCIFDLIYDIKQITSETTRPQWNLQSTSLLHGMIIIFNILFKNSRPHGKIILSETKLLCTSFIELTFYWLKTIPLVLWVSSAQLCPIGPVNEWSLKEREAELLACKHKHTYYHNLFKWKVFIRLTVFATHILKQKQEAMFKRIIEESIEAFYLAEHLKSGRQQTFFS